MEEQIYSVGYTFFKITNDVVLDTDDEPIDPDLEARAAMEKMIGEDVRSGRKESWEICS